MSYYADPTDSNPFDPSQTPREGIFKASPKLLKYLQTSQIWVTLFGVVCVVAAFAALIVPLATNKSTVSSGLEFNFAALSLGLLTMAICGLSGAGLLGYGIKISKFVNHANSPNFVELLKAYRKMWTLLWISAALTCLITFLQLVYSLSA